MMEIIDVQDYKPCPVWTREYAVSTICNAIKLERLDKKLTQEQLGIMCGTSTHYICDLENHKFNPRIDTLLRVMEQLGLTLVPTSIGGKCDA